VLSLTKNIKVFIFPVNMFSFFFHFRSLSLLISVGKSIAYTAVVKLFIIFVCFPRHFNYATHEKKTNYNIAYPSFINNSASKIGLLHKYISLICIYVNNFILNFLNTSNIKLIFLWAIHAMPGFSSPGM
jgi:hypothetical protein